MNPPHTIDWAVALGHLHPLLLHLPIGLFVALAFLQLVARPSAHPGSRRAHGALVLLLVVFTPLAGVTGWLLHEEGGYPDPVELHEWLGISMTFLSLAIGVAFLRRAKAYGWLVGLGFLLLFPTGHFGAVLTHGEDFLLEPWIGDGQESAPAPLTPVELEPSGLSEAEGSGSEGAVGAASALTAAPVAFVPSFDDVQPILARYCDRCHGERKQRGGLALHTLELAQLGGDIGPAVVLGDPDASLLLTRLRLPLEHEDHMPPASKSQPRPDEVALLAAWIGQSEVDSLPAAAPVEEEQAQETEPAALPDDSSAALGVERLRSRLLHVQAVAQGRPQLWIDGAAATLVPGELEALLGPLGPWIEELSLARQPLDGDDLAYLATLPALARLDLRELPGEARGLAELEGAVGLTSINLAGTPLTAAAQDALAGLPALTQVYVWNTGLDAEALRAARPELDVRGSSPPPAEPLELEDVVVFERPVAAVTVEEGAPAAEPVDTAAQPINTTCPVSGSPVDPAHVVIYKGKTVGFCCPNCPRTFEADPTPFLAALGLDDLPTKD